MNHLTICGSFIVGACALAILGLTSVRALHDAPEAPQHTTTARDLGPWRDAWRSGGHLYEWTDPQTGQRVLIAETDHGVALLALDAPLPRPESLPEPVGTAP